MFEEVVEGDNDSKSSSSKSNARRSSLGRIFTFRSERTPDETSMRERSSNEQLLTIDNMGTATFMGSPGAQHRNSFASAGKSGGHVA